MPLLLDAPEADLLEEAEGLLTEPAPVRPRLPDKYEVVFGEVREVRPMSRYAVRVANRLQLAVARFQVDAPVGEGNVELPFVIPQPDDAGRTRIPDWSFTTFARWPADRADTLTGNAAADVVPDIAAEVVSPTDPADELLVKVREYLRGGVRLVWVVYPAAREVHAYRPDSRDVRVYLADDELDAGDILPGFRTPVGPLFPPTEPPAGLVPAGQPGPS